MSKKKAVLKRQRTVSRRIKRTKFNILPIGLLVALCVGSVWGFWRGSLGPTGFRTTVSPALTAPSIPAPSSPSREYIYAGGKLVATEEPTTKADQNITFSPIPNKTYGDASFTLSASAASGLPISFSIISGPANLSGNTVTISGVGSVVVQADQAGSDNFNAAQSVTQAFTIAKAAATVTLNSLTQTYDGTPKAVTTATNPAGLSGITITYDGSTTAPTNAGSYAVVASLTNDNYQAANSTGTLTIAKAAQIITFNPLANKTYGDAPFTVSASSSVGLGVSFSIVSGQATGSGSTITITGAGTVTVRGSQAGNANYDAASDVDRSFSVAKAAATISLGTLSQTYDGSSKAVTATTNPAGLSGITITYDGSSTAPINAGSYAVVAALTNENYQAPNASGTLTIAKAAQTIAFVQPPGKTYGDAPFTVSASASSGLGVSLSIVSGPATVSVNNVTITGAGTVVMRASQVGSANYNAAADLDRSFTVAKATATITLGGLSQTYNGTPRSATPTTNPTGLSGVSITYNASGSAPTAAGSYAVVASLTNDNYTAGNATGTLVIVKATPTVSWNNPADIAYGTALGATQLNAAASFNGSSLAGTFNYSPAAGTVLNVGNNQLLSVTYTPTDSVNFNSAPGSVPINVIQASPSSWDWKFDEGSGTVAADSNGSTNQGTLLNGPGWTTGKSGQALSFDGVNDTVSLSTSGLSDLTNNFTLSFWALPSAAHQIDPEATSGYPGTAGQKYAFVPGWYNAGHAGAGVSVGTNGISVYEHAANYMPATLVYPATITNWTHVAIVYENKQPKLYVNGALVKTGLTSPMSYVHVIPSPIGGMSYGYYGGTLDEVRIYNRALGSSEVVAVYDSYATLNNHSTSFDGSTGRISVPFSSSLNITGPLTVEAWFKVNNNDTTQVIAGNVNSSGGYLLMANSGMPQFYVTTSSGVNDFAITSPPNIPPGVWNHMAGVFDGSQIRVYLNGVLCASKNTTIGPGPVTTDLAIGGNFNGTWAPLNGLIDEVRISTGAVYTSNFTPQNHLMAISNTKGLWKFDGQTLQDASGNSNNGTFVGGASYSSSVP